jgi:hypothetical protein
LQAGGSAGDVTGPYTIAGSAGAQSSNGTYTWSANGNTATLSMQDSVFGSLTETLTFQDPSTGTYTRTAGAGTENGTFTLP